MFHQHWLVFQLSVLTISQLDAKVDFDWSLDDALGLCLHHLNLNFFNFR